MDILEHSKLVCRLSDQIALLNRRILEKTKRGEPVDPDDRLLIDQLLKQLESVSSTEADDEESAEAT